MPTPTLSIVPVAEPTPEEVSHFLTIVARLIFFEACNRINWKDGEFTEGELDSIGCEKVVKWLRSKTKDMRE